MAARKTGRKPRQAEGNGADSLIRALKFVSAAQKKAGNVPYQTHCVFYGGFVTAFDGTLTIGHPIAEDINACPNTMLLLSALLKCGQTLSITQLDSGRLSVKSEKFKALVPCEKFDGMPYVGPDVQCAVIDERIKTGFELVSPLANETAQRTALAAILLQANSTAATNGHVLLEYWHGIDLPPNILLPKPAVKAIVATDKKLVGFGFSDNSATFFFEDKSYIKTQLFQDTYPDISKVLDAPSNPWPLPEGFYTAVDTLESFTETGLLYFGPASMRSHYDANEGASYEITGLPENAIFNAEYLQMIRPGFVKVDFQKDRALFFAENMRGAIMACHPKAT